MTVIGGRRGGRRAVAEINVVPYIDVMLVMLVIFMVTAPLLTPGVDVDLPEASAKVLSKEENEALIVSVDHSGQFYLNRGDDPDRPIDPDDLQTKVSSVLRHRPTTPVLVRGDNQVDYGAVVEVMVLLQQAGAEKVGLVTQESKPRKKQ